MTRGLFRQRRRSFAGVVAIALIALAVGVAQAFAGTGTATAPILKYNDTCGQDNGKSAIGYVTFTRIDKTTLRTAVRLTNATPSMKYYVVVYNGGCTASLFLGGFKTGSDGQGNATFTSSTGGYQSFFAVVYPEGVGVWGESVTVKVDG